MSSSPSSPLNKPSLTDKDWYSIACKIRKQNQELKEKKVELETTIEEQKKQIKVQVIKNQDQNNLIDTQNQKVQELELKIKKYEDKINQKNEQNQKQKLMIDSLNNELKKTQQLAGGLERECSLLQDKYNQIEHQLKQKEKENKELQVRLQRQQRYNVQYKAALDQYLTVSSTPPSDVSSLRIQSWAKDKPDNSTENMPIDLSNENLPINKEDPSIIKNLGKKNNEKLENNSSKNEEYQTPFKENLISTTSTILSQNNLSLPPLNKSAKTDNNLEEKNSDKNKQQSRQSFLKLPKIGE
ncbi:hypothetical protein [Geminocystis sp. GBBB08]|uniref:hypothetical protein n=1 Tax=Geminocystis sp. GBBB08 TaxID=2604140 RepID=UPI0027E2615B|nr:hypothetical protein [Geminocystis sp. GBBB08]MBL1209547.1 hypothetical protein [Geminocystis sp. GBBB08]